MKKLNLNLLILLLFLTAGLPVNAQSLEKDLEALFEAEYPAGHPGAAVLIAKDGEVIFRQAFGSANLELDVPMDPKHILEIGSITKQFTAVAILKLMEEGKLSLQDPLSKYIPDYPNGETITIHHLLNHTSGIKDFVSIPGLNPSDEMSPSETIAFFRDEPVDFAPGEKWKYSNSGYILLGFIIEKVSEMTYEDFIKSKIFKPLEMNSSRYGSKIDVIPNRASGYKLNPADSGYINAPVLNMTIPYASGALMSTVDDMMLWNQAWRNNTLISKKSKELAFKPAILNNGKPFYYGYGWNIRRLYDSPSLEHGGATLGFASEGIYLPKENIYIIVLTNAGGKSAAPVAVEAIATVLGKPLSQKPVPLPEHSLKQWSGAYAFEDGVIRNIIYKEGNLYSQREGVETLFPLLALSENEYRFDNSTSTYTFEKENGKKVVVFSSRTDIVKGKETEATPERKGIAVNQAILDTYSGTYKATPGPVIAVTTKEGRIFIQPAGQPSVEIFAETPEVFFPKAFPAKITFNKDAQGNIKSLTFEQGGNKMEAVKEK